MPRQPSQNVGPMSSRNRLRNWCFTTNNPTCMGEDYATAARTHEHFRYMVYQGENNGTHHLQGYIEFSRPVRFNTVKSLLGGNPHIEPRMGSRTQAQQYCMKSDTRVAGEGPWEYGTFSDRQGRRTDMDDAMTILQDSRSLREVALNHRATFCRYSKGMQHWLAVTAEPRRYDEQPEILLFYGPPGAGKTRRAYEIYPDLFSKPLDANWWDGYEGQETVLIDDFAGRASHYRLDSTLRMLDRYPFDCPIKGSYVPLQAMRIIVTTNIHPRLWFDWDNREVQFYALSRRFTAVRYFPAPAIGSFVVGLSLASSYIVEMPTFFECWHQCIAEDGYLIRLASPSLESIALISSDDSSSVEEPSTEDTEVTVFDPDLQIVVDATVVYCSSAEE